MLMLTDIKAANNNDRANIKTFQFNCASLPFMVAGKLFCTRILFEWPLVLQLKKEFFFSLLFKRYHVFYLYLYIAFVPFLIQFSLPFESFDKFTPKNKFLG